jgi:hypothetical protein
MSIFCVIRSATALSIIAAVNIRRDTRNRRTFARMHSVRMLATPTDMSVPGERFFSEPMQLMTASTPSRGSVIPTEERTSPRTKDSRSADDSRSGWRATAVTKCPCARACFTTLRPVAPVAPTTAIFMSRPVGTHHDDSGRERQQLRSVDLGRNGERISARNLEYPSVDGPHPPPDSRGLPNSQDTRISWMRVRKEQNRPGFRHRRRAPVRISSACSAGRRG